MRTASIHEAKTHLSRLLKCVAAGENIIITSRGMPVATISGPPKRKKRILGCFEHLAHKYPLPDDFDEPMPDAWFFPDEDKLNR